MSENESKSMSEARLLQLLDSYGGDAARWPAAERTAALALLATRPDLEERRRAAAMLDGLLLQAERPAASGALMARLMEAAPQPRRRWLAEFWPFGPAWQPAFGLAIALVLGVVSGGLLPQADASQSIESQSSEELAILLAAPLYEEDSL